MALNLNYNDNGIFGSGASFPIINGYENMLILAEAAARTGNEILARDTFNALRSQLATEYSGSFPATTATGQDLIYQILEEKYCTLVGSITSVS